MREFLATWGFPFTIALFVLVGWKLNPRLGAKATTAVLTVLWLVVPTAIHIATDTLMPGAILMATLPLSVIFVPITYLILGGFEQPDEPVTAPKPPRCPHPRAFGRGEPWGRPTNATSTRPWSVNQVDRENRAQQAPAAESTGVTIERYLVTALNLLNTYRYWKPVISFGFSVLAVALLLLINPTILSQLFG